MTRIALIIDKSPSYLSYQVGEVLKSWGMEKESPDRVSSLSAVGVESLFDGVPCALMEITDLESWKKLSAAAEKLYADSPDDFIAKVEHGLIITTTVSRASTKKLEALVSTMSGDVITAKANAKDNTNVTGKLLRNLSIPRQVENFLVEFAAEDYDSILSVVASISTLPPQHQKRLTVDDVIIRLPSSPGSTPPWEIEKPLMKGDVPGTIEMYRRITNRSHGLVVLSIIKNKFTLSWRVAALLAVDSKMTSAAIAAALDVPNNYPLKLAIGTATRCGVETLTNVLTTVLAAESDVKGGSSAASGAVMENMLVKVCQQLS